MSRTSPEPAPETAAAADQPEASNESDPTSERLLRSLSTRPFRRALRIGSLLPLTLGAFLWADQGEAGFNAAFALICLLVLTDFSGPRRERAASMVLTGLAGAITMAIGALCSFSPALLVVMALALGFAVTLMGVLRGFVSSAGTPVLLPFFLAATTASAPTLLPQMELGWLVGTVVSVAAGVWFWPYFPRATLTECVRSILRCEATAVSCFWTPDADRDRQQATVSAIDRQVTTLEKLLRGQLNRPGSAYRRERTFLRLLEEVRRLRLGLRLLAWEGGPTRYPADKRLAEVTSSVLASSADQLTSATADLTAFHELEKARSRHWDELEGETADLLAAGDSTTINKRVPASFSARMVSMLSVSTVRDATLANADPRLPIPPLTFRGIPVPGVISVINPWRQLQSELNPAAPWFRNALRLGIAIAAALLVVEFTGVERGYWVVLGTLSVLRLDRQSTRSVAWQVFLGQLLGFLIGGALLLALRDHAQWGWATLPLVAGFLGYAVGTKGTIIVQATFTTTLMNLVAITSPGTRGVPELRLLDVGLGLAVAVVVSLLVAPRGLMPQIEGALIAASDASSDLLRAAVSRLAGMLAGEADVPTTDTASTTARVALARATETVDLGLAQGASRGAQTIVWARVLSMIEHVTYVSQVISMQVADYPGDLHARRAAGDLVAASDAVARRMAANVRRLVAVLDDLPPEAVVSSALLMPELLPDLAHARGTVESKVEIWAAQRDATMAPTVSRLFWTLRWLEEIDLIVSNVGAIADELRNQRSSAQRDPHAAAR